MAEHLAGTAHPHLTTCFSQKIPFASLSKEPYIRRGREGLQLHHIITLMIVLPSQPRDEKEEKMASTPAKSFSVRSTSFPSKSHPNLARVQECLHVFKAWEASPSRKAKFVTSVAHLKDLYTSINAFLQLPLSQQALCGKEKLVGELMDDFVCLMDVCGMVKDSLLHMKEQYQDLRSMLRRGNSGLEASICAYQCSRKRMKKDMAKCLRLLGSVEKHACPSNDNLDVVDQVFKDVRAVAVSVLSLLSSIISGQKTSQSIFSKFRVLGSKSQNKEGDQDGVTDIEKADVAILSHSLKAVREVDARDLQKQMETLDLMLRETEVELEDFFRCLIQAKVSLLNIVTGC